MASTARTDDAAARAVAPAAAFGTTDIMLLMMALLWGINFSVVKVGTRLLDPMAFNGVRVALAVVCLLVIASAFLRKPWPRGRELATLFFIGMLGNGIYQLFFITGISRTRAGTAALVLAAGPAFVALLGRLRGTERIALRGWIGIALQLGGMGAVVMGSAQSSARGDSLLGNTLILIGGLCWAVFTVLLKPFTTRVHGLHISAITMGGGALLLLAVGAPAIASADWRALPLSGWLAILYAGVGALVIAYLLWYRGLKVLGPTRTAMYINLQPLIALLIAWATLNEVPTPWQWLGAASIMTGLVLART